MSRTRSNDATCPRWTVDDEAELLLLLKQAQRSSLIEYVRAAYPKFVIAPWQIDLCEKLEQFVRDIEDGNGPRLMVFAPPQCGKSVIVSRAFPAWLAGRHPEWSGIMASYAGSLATTHGRWIRNRIASRENRMVFPLCALTSDSKAKDHMNLTEGGQIISRGIGGASTGNPAQWVIIDDPIKDRAAADSPTQIQATHEWYEAVPIQRIGPGGGILIMHTRWAMNDLAGHLLDQAKQDPEKDQWTVVNYPAQWEPGVDASCYTAANADGWLKCRFRPKDFIRKKANLSSREWTSVFQQRPMADGGSVFRLEWITEEKPPPGWKPTVYQAWDLAGTDAEVRAGGCYSVGVAMCIDWLRRWWLLEVVRGQWSTGELCERIIAFAEKWDARQVWGEDPVALYIHDSLIEKQRLRGRYIPFKRQSVQGRGNKLARAQASIVPVMESGMFRVPMGSLWLPALKDELGAFPAGAYMDQTDGLSLCMHEMKLSAIVTDEPVVAASPLPERSAVTHIDELRRRVAEQNQVGQGPRSMFGR